MAWKLFGKLKPKEEKIKEPEESYVEEDIEENTEIEELEPEKKSKDEPLAEYSETLETGKPTSQKSSTTTTTNQRVWRDVKGIENRVDTIHIARAQKPVTELDKKVDKLIEKRKKK